MTLHQIITSVSAAVLVLMLTSCSKPKEMDYAKLDMVKNLLTDPDTQKPFTGVSRDYHPGGKLRAEYPIKNGVFHGTVKEWYANGNPFAQTDFVNGERSGRNMEWLESGAPFQERIYERDRIVSERKFEAGK